MKKIDENKYYDIVLTDIQPHVIKPTNPKPFPRVLEKCLKNNKPGRVRAKDLSINENGIIKIDFDLPESCKGKKVRIFIPKNGVDIYPSTDSFEKAESLKRKLKK
jgi:hypothetical protein